MKKLLLSIAMLAGCVLLGNAQTLSFLDKEGNVIPNGSVFVSPGYEINPDYGEVIDGMAVGYVQVVVDPKLKLLSTASGTVTVKTTSLNGEDYQLCAGSDCINTAITKNPVITKDAVAVTANTPLELQLEALPFFIDAPVVIPEYDILVEAWSNNNPTDKITMTVKMGNVADAGVEGVSADNNSVKVNGRLLKYDLTGSTLLNVYSISGKTVISRQVSGTGSIDLSNLPAGIYLFKTSDKKLKAGKFIIK